MAADEHEFLLDNEAVADVVSEWVKNQPGCNQTRQVMCRQFLSHLVPVMLLLSSAVLVHGQWSIVGTPPWTATSLQTTGGITYFLHSASLLACNKVETSPIVRSGTDLSLTAAQMSWSGLCVYCYDCYHTQTSATVLGDLTPGSYRLWIYSYPFHDPQDPFPPVPSLWQVRDFQVAAETGTTLELSASTHEVRVCLRGVPAAAYVLEGSTNLLAWTSLHTNTGGPCTFTNQVAPGETRFFRVRVLSGSLNSP